MQLRTRLASFPGVLAVSFAVSIVAVRTVAGQATVTRLTGPQPWRAANAGSNSAWSPERNGMAISADNRWVVFESGANNIAPYDKNPSGDVFAFEVATGRIVGITTNKSFTANGASYDPAISGNGRWVVFVSNASNLVANDSNHGGDVFLVDRDLDGNGIFDEQPYVFERISVDSSGNQSHGDCTSPCVTDDGTHVLYLSDAFDLVDNDNNFATDAFLYDRAYGTTDRVDVDSQGNEADYGCSSADMTPDGSVVAFGSDSDNLVANDWNQLPDVFLRDLGTGSTELVSADPSGYSGDASSYVFRHCLSADGRFVAFQSFADNLTTDTTDYNGASDVYRRDRWSGSTTLVSCDSLWNQGDGDSGQPTISGDGSRITFVTSADNMAWGDGNGKDDVFLRDLGSGALTLLSAEYYNGACANGCSGAATINSDGSRVVFSSDADDLVATGDVAGFRDVFLRDLSARTTRYVTDLPAGDPNGPSMLPSDDRSTYDHPALSADGRFVAFESEATNLFDGDVNGAADVFVFDRTTGAIVPISVTSAGLSGNGRSSHPTMSSTGRFIAYASEATTLIGSDANGTVCDVFLCDRDPDGNGIFDEGNATTSLVSVDSSGNQANDRSDAPSICGDGSRIAFTSTATNLEYGEQDASADIYVRDVGPGITTAVTKSTSPDFCDRPSISSDGYAIAYTAYTFNAWGQMSQTVMEDAPVLGGLFTIEGTVWGYPSSFSPCNSQHGDRVAISYYDPNYNVTSIEVVDPISYVEIWSTGCAGSCATAMNAAGRQVTVPTTSPFSGSDANTTRDVYLFDVEQSQDGYMGYFRNPILVSRTPTGAAGNADSLLAVPSEDGNLVAFASDASDLVTGDTNGCRDLFLFDRTTAARRMNYGSGFAYPHWIPNLTSDVDPVLGSTITLSFGNSSGIPVNALVFLGLNDANVALPWGATFLVDLSTAIRFLVPLGGSGGSVSGTVPSDPALAGLSVYLQALEYDSVVPHKLAFTPGLELRFGY